MGAYQETSDLYYAAARQREAVATARAWLVDYAGDMTNEARTLRLAGSLFIVDSMERNYAGGWIGFLRATDNLRENRP
jgi:hypothetical protein